MSFPHTIYNYDASLELLPQYQAYDSSREFRRGFSGDEDEKSEIITFGYSYIDKLVAALNYMNNRNYSYKGVAGLHVIDLGCGSNRERREAAGGGYLPEYRYAPHMVMLL